MRRTLNSSKSHLGCQRCKAKKVKCDEAKPECHTCVKDGVTCPGFTPTLKWSRKHEVFGRPKPRPRVSHRHSGKRTTAASTEEDNDEVAVVTSSTAVENHFESSPTEAESPSWYERVNADSTALQWLNPEFIDGYENLMLSVLEIPYTDHVITTPDQSPTLTNFACDSDTCPGTLSGIFETESHSSTSNGSPKPPNLVESQATGHASLLATFYRLSTPNPNPCFSGEHLVQHFFEEVCSLYSCFDSHLNPFRSLVADLWTGSTTMYLAIQSMAIAHLANHYLYMAPLGHLKRCQAWKSLQSDLQRYRVGKMPLETILISLLLLGLSASWHQASNLGLQYLFIARGLVQNYLKRDRSLASMSAALPNEKFILDALIHWEMLASLIEPVEMMSFPGFGAPCLPLPPDSDSILPHPWTGVTTELHFALAELGRLLRRRYSTKRTWNHMKETGKSRSMEEDKQWAVSLERLLHSVSIPSPSAVVEYADEFTPKEDLISSAHAYRYMGLLEIYRAFPHVLERKINSGEEFPSSSGSQFVAPSNASRYLENQESCLTDIARHGIDLIKDIAISSGACRLHPLVLVSCASHLRLPDDHESIEDHQNICSESIIEIRGIVDARMLALSRKYPQQQLSQMLEIVKETWQRLDEAQPCTHWLQVAHQQGWQTMMG